MQTKRRPSGFFYLIPLISLLLAFVIFILGIFMNMDINNAIKVQCPGSYTINLPTEGKYIVFYNFNSSNNSLDYALYNSPIDLQSIKYNIYDKEENTYIRTSSCLGNYSYINKDSASLSLVSFTIDNCGTYQFSTTSTGNGSITLLICKTSTTLFILCTLAFILLLMISIISFIIIFIKRKTLISVN